jgi:isopenicillin N synthase-like dioxygenase
LGFVRVKGHNVTPSVTTPAYQKAKEFFRLSEEAKLKYKIRGGAGQRGYTPYLAESAKGSDLPDLKEFWHVGRELPAAHRLYSIYPPNVWPDEIDGFRDALMDLYESLERCSNILLRGLALYLGQEEDIFTSVTDEGNTILRSLYYPAMKDREVVPGAVRAAAHEDINFITLLISSTSSGLQLLTRDGKWLDVNAEAGEIVADSGDMLSRVTNGILPATTHRVINPDSDSSERYSIPFFVHPRPQSVLSVLDNCKGEGFPEPPENITGIDFLNERLAELGLNKI